MTPSDVCELLALNGGDRSIVAGLDLMIWHEAVTAFDSTDPALPVAERWTLAAKALAPPA